MHDLPTLLGASQAPIVTTDVGGIRFVILNRPAARNALTRDMRTEFARIMSDAETDSTLDAMVLTGAGGAFSGGVDLKDRVPGAAPVEPNPAVALRNLTKPVIAAVDGACVTGAIEMALSCDFVIGTPAARFADTHCKVGLFPRWGGGALLTSAIGVRRARQMMLTGAFVDAETALAWGLLNEIVPADRLLDRAAALARTMADRAEEHPLSYRLHSRLLCAIDAQNPAIAIEREFLARFDDDRMREVP